MNLPDFFYLKFICECKNQLGEIDEDLLLKFLLEHKMLFPMYEVINSTLKPKYQYAHAIRTVLINKKIHALGMYLNKCMESSIYPIVLKGSALSYVLYNSLYFRDYEDLDILVRERDFQKANSILFSMGFRRNIDIIAEKLNLDIKEGDKYNSEREIVWTKNGIVIEVKTNSGLLGETFFNQMFSDPIYVELSGISFLTASVEKTLIYLVWTVFENFYVENNFFQGGYLIRDIYDFMMFVQKNYLMFNDDFFSSPYFSLIYKYIPYVIRIVRDFDEKLFQYLPAGLKSLVNKTSDFPRWLSICESTVDFKKGLFFPDIRKREYINSFFNAISSGKSDKFWPVTFKQRNDNYISMYVTPEFNMCYTSRVKFHCSRLNDCVLFDFLFPEEYRNLICSIDVFSKSKRGFVRKNEFVLDFDSLEFVKYSDNVYEKTINIFCDADNISKNGRDRYFFFYITIYFVTNKEYVIITNSGHLFYPNRAVIN